MAQLHGAMPVVPAHVLISQEVVYC